MKILQIGCHDGKDHVYDFVKNAQVDRLVLVDASLFSLQLCKKQYDNDSFCEFVYRAIVTDPDLRVVPIYAPVYDLTSVHVSTDLNNLKKHGHSHSVKIDVECCTLNVLLEELSLFNLDRLYIDAEGLDISIINSLSLEKYEIPYIFFEHAHSNGDLKQCVDRLESLGYTVVEVDDLNSVAEKLT